jgi:hypothetical protein
VCAVAAERAFDEIGPLEAQRFEDALSQGVAKARAGRFLDEEAKHDVVAAVIGPSVAGLRAGNSHGFEEMLGFCHRVA